MAASSSVAIACGIGSGMARGIKPRNGGGINASGVWQPAASYGVAAAALARRQQKAAAKYQRKAKNGGSVKRISRAAMGRRHHGSGSGSNQR